MRRGLPARAFSIFPTMSRTSSRRRPPASRPNPVQKRSSHAIPVPTGPARKKLFVSPRQREVNTKRRGELAELAFAYKATSRGLGVSKPFGDSERYDTIIDPRELLPHPRRSRQNPAPNSPDAPSVPRSMRRQSRPAPVEVCGPSAAAAPVLRGVRRVSPAPLHHQHLTRPLWRVQVKCSTQLMDGLYRTNAHRRSGGRAVPYLPGEIDFIAAYIIPEDTWYIIPLEAIRGRTSLLFRRAADPRPGLYDAYYEAWHLLRPNMTTCPHCGTPTPAADPSPESHPQRPRKSRKQRGRPKQT